MDYPKPDQTPKIESHEPIPADRYNLAAIVQTIEAHFGVTISEDTARELAEHHAYAGNEILSHLRVDYDDDELIRFYRTHEDRLELEDPDVDTRYWETVLTEHIGDTNVIGGKWAHCSRGHILFLTLKDAAPLAKPHVCDYIVNITITEQ